MRCDERVFEMNVDKLTSELKLQLQESCHSSVTVEFIKFSSNHNFKVAINGSQYLCRVYKGNKWSAEQILAELTFLTKARCAGLNVQSPVAFGRDECLSKLENTNLHYSLFEWCPGVHRYPAIWDEDFVFSWGKALGELHEFCKGYEETAGKRPAHMEVPWHSNLLNLLGQCGFDEQTISTFRDEHERVQEFFSGLETSSDVYGYVHYDFHPGNILVDGEDFWLIDFDDLCHHWFAWDFAMVFHKLSGKAMSHQNDKLKATFVKGYRTKTVLKFEWERRLRLFERIRHLFMIGWLARKRDEEKWAWLLPRYAKVHSKYVREHTFGCELD